VLIYGIDELGFFWDLMFDWNIPTNIKANFEKIFVKSLVYWD
jgi:hypothetical protein